ncbi:AP-3 complex subunit sigma-2 isoform X2 [Phyllopteryx taeniolatus]|uniref:AP-3 complex subunit sigma-2 isoform X2 n=1 Tax=Phyllopteryx taeniolatus TaxID=161469 RepID=UPI002AD4A833|nr:AP-3 complex subunit sigma-2 isoform X2 [Phyllopteryx taeniolatus]
MHGLTALLLWLQFILLYDYTTSLQLLFALHCRNSHWLLFTLQHCILRFDSRWWCTILLKNLGIEGYGRRFAHYTNKGAQMACRSLRPVFRISRQRKYVLDMKPQISLIRGSQGTVKSSPGGEVSPIFQAEDMQQQIIRETFHLVSKRDDNVCNFLEGGSLIGGSDYKLIYRHYATLYFVFCVDSSESELGILDLIQVFVETLDKCFENVCELDLIFHMDKVHYILQEVVMGGMVLETNMNEIVAQVELQNRMEKSEGGLSAAPARAVSAVKNMNLPEIPRNINIGDINIKVPSLSPF